MHVNMETSMSYIVSSERTSRLPACLSFWWLIWKFRHSHPEQGHQIWQG